MSASSLDCTAVADLLDAAADEALPPPAAAEVAGHLASCPRCAAEVAAIRALREDLARLPRAAPPPGLEQRLRAALPAAPPAALRRRPALGLAAAGLAGLALGAGLGWAGRGAPPLAPHDLLVAHRRALLGAAPPQVASGDPHSVRPWLVERLPLAPRVLDPPGFPLEGARLDLVADRVVAALLHRRRRHLVTVFATATEAPGWPTAPASVQGFTLIPWIADGVHYVAVSDLNAGELAEFAALLGRGR